MIQDDFEHFRTEFHSFGTFLSYAMLSGVHITIYRASHPAWEPLSYSGGRVSKVSAIFGSQLIFAFPKISAPTGNLSLPSFNKPVRATIVSGPITSWWW